MRSSWVYCEIRQKLIPKGEFYGALPERGPLICPDISEFVSSVDGSVITGRAALREHNIRNGVTFAEDFRGEWAKKAQERSEFMQGKGKGSITRKHIAEAYERVRDGYKPQRNKENE